MNRLIAIVGPTGTGKSRLGVHLAQLFGGEIVSADSRQIYRHMDIGTAKPAPDQLALVPHHLINIIDPSQDFSQSEYQEMAYRAINDIQQRRRLPLLVGGSGLYVWSVLEGWRIPRVPPDPAFRNSLEEKTARLGGDELYYELKRLDPLAAERIDRHNIRRLIRALEVHRDATAPFPQLQNKVAPPFTMLIIGLTANRKELYRQVDLRVDRMIENGLVEEMKKLPDMGYSLDLPAMSGIGYRQIGMFLRDELTLEAAVQKIKSETHRLIRHQYNWFRLTDRRIKWFDIQVRIEPEVENLVADFIVSK